MNRINDTIQQLNDMYDYLRKALSAKLPEDVIFSLIPNRGKGKYYGWFAQNRWKQSSNTIHEINITSDFLDRSVDDIAETMIHELTHLQNFVAGIKDCTHTQYHNKAFKKQAEAFGLKVERMRNKGYALTSLDDKARAIVDAYKTDVLKGTNPFVIHRISDARPTRASDKKSVGVKRDLADRVMLLGKGSKLSHIVEEALEDWEVTHPNFK